MLSHVDEVYIFYLDFDLEFVVNVTKEDFLSHYIRSNEIHRLVVNDSYQIEQLSNAPVPIEVTDEGMQTSDIPVYANA